MRVWRSSSGSVSLVPGARAKPPKSSNDEAGDEPAHSLVGVQWAVADPTASVAAVGGSCSSCP